MKSVTFPQVNLELAKDQEQYETLLVHAEIRKMPVDTGFKHADKSPIIVEKDIAWSMTACFELSPEELEEVNRTGRIWYKQMLFGHNFQPLMMSTQSPFPKDEEKPAEG